MAYTNPQPSDFQAYFVRDFPYGTDINTTVTTTDIANAMQMTNININQAQWSDQGSYNVGYLLLSAHYLVMNLWQAQGKNAQYNFLENNKAVGGVNQSFSIPERVLDNPLWSQLFKTNYGAQYMQLLLPQLAGQMYVVHGTTLP